MTNLGRIKNDVATRERRDIEDKNLSESRNRNDTLTQERRFEADKTMGRNRSRNDEKTANRRKMKDGNNEMVLAISLVLITLTIAIFFLF